MPKVQSQTAPPDLDDLCRLDAFPDFQYMMLFKKNKKTKQNVTCQQHLCLSHVVAVDRPVSAVDLIPVIEPRCVNTLISLQNVRMSGRSSEGIELFLFLRGAEVTALFLGWITVHDFIHHLT